MNSRKFIYSSRHARAVVAFVLLVVVCISVGVRRAGAQTLSGVERDRGRAMLGIIRDEVKKNYYDATYRGMDVDARFKAAEEKIGQATSLGQVFGIIAQALAELNDSHTFFLPPPRAARADYGWEMQTIGDKTFIVAVKPGSDAEAKGVKEGDELLLLDGFKPSRANIWKMNYRYHTLAPTAGVRMVLQSPDQGPRSLDVKTKIVEGKRRLDFREIESEDIWNYLREADADAHHNRHRYYEDMEGVFVWKMPRFDLSADEIDSMMSRAKKRKAMILDLRGNGGGLVTTLQRLVANVFDHDVKIADLKGRKEMKPHIAKTRGGDNVFKGKLVVLIDSKSGSASELFARLVQLEKRGTVIGDRSAGAVMRAQPYTYEMGAATVISYGVLITDADLIMTDGKSLEHTGVTPDELLLPTAQDLAARRDPVLARAAAILGLNLTPDKAGTLFPLEWRK
ncbi:MAG TPA: S41 family peptidase [Pyrinomonadaceae bacterium]|nr:S41 family peptidase [Pyrinomonadaceae bacterium]